MSSGDDREATDDGREARERARYLARKHPELRERVALAIAYRELGYTASGITVRMDTTEPTVRTWLDQVAARYGLKAIETKWGEQRQGPLGEPTTEQLLDDYSIGVLGDYLAIAQANPECVPASVDPIALEERIEDYLRGAQRNPEDVPDDVDLDALADLLGGWFG